MLAFTLPALPLDKPSVLLAQAPATQATPLTANDTVVFCRDAESALPHSAANDFTPIPSTLAKSLGLPSETITDLSKFKVTLLEPPQHGEAKLIYLPSHHWSFAPTKGYTGADRITYLVEAQGKQFKVVVNFWVVELVDDKLSTPTCESHQFPQSKSGAATAQSTELKPPHPL